ncbi:hypothetical protein VSDG_07505 [Cytospora chrysosperma]|uniref:Uncharacterized protein n=1 Tax=Cytospora chrysosperma TaxID=252740 RepID=A0A423VM76_CYTCH|nr:hypothetical protein VSDG_07505 [Valsa sordida]
MSGTGSTFLTTLAGEPMATEKSGTSLSMLRGGSIKTPLPTLPNCFLSMASRSAASESGVASSGKWLLYLCMNLRAWNLPWTSSGAVQLYLQPSD